MELEKGELFMKCGKCGKETVVSWNKDANDFLCGNCSNAIKTTFYQRLCNEKIEGIKVFQVVSLGNSNHLLLERHFNFKNGTHTPKVHTIKQIMKIWGVEKYYGEMINRFKGYGRNYKGVVMTLRNDISEYKWKTDPAHQKLLYFEIMDKETGEGRYNSGVLFQNGKMSFHT